MSEHKKPQDHIDPTLLALLCCPSCKKDSQLSFTEDNSALACDLCQRKYKLKEVPGPDNKGLFIPELLLTD